VPRTRSATAHKKVLQAALELVAERGFDATSMDAVAQKSGVSKATIYKHWSDKEALMLEMMADINGLRDRPSFDSGNTRRDMIAVLAYKSSDNAEMREKILPHFMAYAGTHPKVGMAWRKMVTEPPRRELSRLLELGTQKGEFTSKLDIEFCLALLLGPMIYWHIFLRRNTEDPKPLAESVIDVFWRAFGTGDVSCHS
jgi:AcrR family transcriptional regulator